MKSYAISVLLLTLSASVATAEILKKEPKMGGLREGQTVLVDDGSCPKGQIKRVVGGNHQKVGGSKQNERSRTCVPR
ncbi:MAG TPA: DUF6719 family protein [Candidatus Binatia bacterium]|nr:DUF6719 family protein [Candidatus Binatia bacterium]